MADVVIGEPNTSLKLNRLINYINENKSSSEKQRVKVLGRPFPYWAVGQTAEVGLRRLDNLFNELSTIVSETTVRSDLTFVDLGSNDGTVCAAALCSGLFKKAIGIEIDQEAHLQAEKNKTELQKLGIISEGSLDLLHGSYYLPKYWEKGLENLKKIDPSLFSAIAVLPTEEVRQTLQQEGKEAVLSKIEPRLMEYGKSEPVISQLMDTDGKLKGHVFFWYPSDFIAPHTDQWSNCLRKDAYFVVTLGNGQIDDMVNSDFFDNFDRVALSDKLSNSFAVFRKK